MTQTSKKIVIILVLLITVSALYYIFFTPNEAIKDPEKKQVEIQKNLIESKPVTVNNNPIESLPIKLPDLPHLIAPPAPPPPLAQKQEKRPTTQSELPRLTIPLTNIVKPDPQPQDFGYPSINKPLAINKNKRSNMIQDRNTPMLIISGSNEGAQNTGLDLSNPANLINGNQLNKLRDSLKVTKEGVDENSPINRTSSEQVKITYIGDQRLIIAQGKIIDAVLETSINTDLKGMLRAIISRDVYSEAGKHILLPRGSRLIGSYNSALSPSQVRVDIIWNRVIRPDGIDLQIESPATDPLGKSGITGDVDTKFSTIFANSFLISSVKVAGAVVLKKLFGDTTTKKETTGSTTVETSDSSAQLAKDGIDKFTQGFENVIKQYENNKPTIRIDQGTLIKVFVNKDLVFSDNINNRTKVVD